MQANKRRFLEGSNCCEDFEWEDLTGELTRYMLKINPAGYWKARVKNFGWRALDGEKRFYADTGAKLLSEVLPDTECSFRVHKYGKTGIALNNAHHDSPCWAEWYYIVKAKGGED